MTDPGERRALRAYRLLLRLFPRRFRQERAATMERLFLDMRASLRESGRRPGLRFWVPLVWDAVTHALRERAASLGPDPRGPRGRTAARSRRERFMAAFWMDLRYAVRSLGRQPLYAGLVVLMMTLGIAGNAAVFRVFNGLFLKPLPFENPGQLVDLDTRAPRWNLEYTGVAYADFAAWREGNETFQGMGVLTRTGANLASDDGALRVEVVAASHDLAPVLGLDPVRGRLFTAAEDVPDGPRVALLTHGFWERRYGGDPDVVGRAAVLDGEPHEIVGILPPAASFVAGADLWVPLQEDATEHESFYLGGIGRLRPGVDAARAEEDLARIHAGLIDEFPVNESTSPVVGSLRDRYLGDYRLSSLVLLGAVAAVLLIACANIAGLMLARSLARGREIGIRLALGAGRRRVVRQLLTESLVLAALGALLGTAAGVWGSGLLVAGLDDRFPAWVTFELDAAFVLFAVAVTVGATILFGLAPALHGSGVDPAGSLQASTARTTPSSGRRRAMGALVVAEVALSFVLLVVAGLSVRDFHALRTVDPGFRTEGVLTWLVELPDGRYPSAEERLLFWDRHVEGVSALPGVLEAAATTVLPLSGHSGWFFQVEGAPERGEDEPNPVVLNRGVTPGYLDAMDVRLLAGRGFTGQDGREEGSWVAVVNETFVREFLSHRPDPLGARIRTGSSSPWRTVVGVARDTRHYGLDEEMRPAVYQPLVQLPASALTVVAHTGGDPTALVSPVREVLRSQDPALAMFGVTTMRELLDDSLWTRRAASWLIAVFSTVALLLAVAGLYGVISYGVRQRVGEIGVRMALGARRDQVAGQVLLRGMLIVGGGMVLGLAGALLVAPLVSGALFTVSPTDPVVYAGVAVIVAAVAALANLLPARRAAGLDPMGVLRGE